MIKISIIGAGAMGLAIAKGLLAAKLYQAEEIDLVALRQEKLVKLQKDFGFSISDSISASCKKLDSHGILLIAVKPQKVDEVLNEITNIEKTNIIVSIAAGIKTEKFANQFPHNPICRVMPNTPTQINEGASAIAINDKTSNQEKDLVEKIFNSIGETVFVEEKDLDAVTALSGSGPAYIFLLTEAMQEAGEKLGLNTEVAKKLAKQTTYGAAKLMLESDLDASSLRAQVTSPNGTTHAAISSFEDQGFRDVVFKALKAARDRSEDLS